MDTTFSATQIQTLIAAGIDLNEFFGNATTPAKPAYDREAHKAALAHCHDRRMDRRANTEFGGLKKAERRALAAILREELGREYTAEEWAENVAAYKAGEFTIVGF